MNSNAVLVASTRKGLLVLKQRDGKWAVIHESFPGMHVSLSGIDRRSGHLYVMIDTGHFGMKLHRCNQFLQTVTDSGSKEIDALVFEELEAPKYPEGSKLKNGNDATLKYQWAFATGDENQPGRIYIGTEPGGLFISDDHGESFKLCSGLWDHPSRLDQSPGWMGGGRDEPGIHSICVDPRDADTIRVAISCAGVFRSQDGGESWHTQNKGLKAEFLPDPDSDIGHDPHLMVQCDSQPDKLWQQNHCGIFCTTDGAENWTGVSQPEVPAHFGFAVVTDPNNGDIAWVVPAEADMVRAAVHRKLGVSRTLDGGKTWQHFTNGLPQENCYDFAFRHSLDLLGDQLAFGTACGSIYVSDDRGENWTTVGSHFPPVYALEFATIGS